MRLLRAFQILVLASSLVGTGLASGEITADILASKDSKSSPQKPAQKPPEKKPAPKSDKPTAKPPEKKPADKPADKPAAKSDKPFAIGGEVDAAISVTDLAGKAQSFKDLRGKIVVVQFWSMSSNAYDKRLAALATEYAAKNVVFLALDADKPDGEDAKKLSEYVGKSGITFPVAIDKDGKLAERFAAQTSAHAFVIDAKGMLRYSGAIDDDPKGEKADKATHYLKGALDALVAGKEVTPPTTTPNGNPIAKGAPAKDGKDPKGGK